MQRKVILGVSGASGQVYAESILAQLIDNKNVIEIALVFSENGIKVWDYEKIAVVQKSKKLKVLDNLNLFAAPSSGSSMYTDMFVVPCSMGTLSKIAHGAADNLILRAADVMLKERRNLLLFVREAPYSLIHLKNMTQLSEAGAIVFPASPFFYHFPKNIHELVNPLTSRALSVVGLAEPDVKWK